MTRFLADHAYRGRSLCHMHNKMGFPLHMIRMRHMCGPLSTRAVASSDFSLNPTVVTLVGKMRGVYKRGSLRSSDVR